MNPATPRFARLDALRGCAMLWMAAFHFCFDLNQFRFIRQDFYENPFNPDGVTPGSRSAEIRSRTSCRAATWDMFR